MEAGKEGEEEPVATGTQPEIGALFCNRLTGERELPRISRTTATSASPLPPEPGQQWPSTLVTAAAEQTQLGKKAAR